MWKEMRKILIVLVAVVILTIGGCKGYLKTNYAADASFVINVE